MEIMISVSSHLCKNFRKDTETCNTGCKVKDVKPKSICPYYDEDKLEEQESCPCYK